MVLAKAALLDGSGATLFETMVERSEAPDRLMACAANALHAAAIAVADGTVRDHRSVQRVAHIRVEGEEPVPLDALIRWMIDTGRAGEAAVVTTVLADGVGPEAPRRRLLRLVPQ